MSQKRKFEEFHDPDYPQEQPEIKKAKPNDVTAEALVDRPDRIRAIVRREFERELSAKEQELARIEHKLLQAKRLLQRVRYAVVFSYYTKKNLEYSESELRNELTMNSASSETVVVAHQSEAAASVLPVQKAVHPSLKKLLGKKTIDYNEILKMRPARQAAKDAKTSISEKLRSKKDERKLRMAPTETVTRHTDEIKIPRYISPTKVDRPIDKINTARGRNQTRHLIAVGNTSKYIDDDKSQQGGVTHKWLVYVKTKTDAASVEDIVTKVRFFLHPSYKPNDVVDVDSSPFQISRRGWGEFPIRVQLYFHAHIQQKPLQIIHNLVLDKKLTGLQTMGAETVVEMWLKLPPGVGGDVTRSSDHGSPQKIQMRAIAPNVESPKKSSITPHTNGRKSIESTSSSTVSVMQPFKCDNEVNIIESFSHIGQVGAMPENLFDEVNPVWDHESVINHDFGSPSSSLLNGQSSSTTSTSVNVPSTTNIEQPVHQPEVKSEPIVATTIKVESVPTNSFRSPVASFDMTPPVTPVHPVNALPLVQNKPVTPTAPAPNPLKTPPRKFMKCLDSNGKVILVELKVDPNNPKSFKIIKNPTQTNKPLIKLSNPGLNAAIQPLKLPASSIKIEPNKSATPPTLDIKTAPQGRLIILPKSSIINNGTASASPKPQTRVITQPNAPTRPLPSSLVRVPNQTAKKTTVSQLPTNLIKPNNVIMRNGKMFIIDPTKVVPKSVLPPAPIVAKPPPSTTSSTKPKQQSLLKPQISLLKPRPGVVPPKTPSPAVHRQTIGVSSPQQIPPQQTLKLVKTQISAAGSIMMRPPKNQLDLKTRPVMTNGAALRPVITQAGRLLQLPAVVMPPEKSVFNSNVNKFIISHNRRDFMRDLEQQFFGRRHFRSRRSAIEFLLRNVPVVHRLAATRNVEFQQVFPFAVGSMATFESLLLPKKRSIEWSRAKFISRLLRKHTDLHVFPEWSTKEIVLYARQFGHTPPCVTDTTATTSNDPSATNGSTESTQSKLSSLIKKEMKREQSQHETISMNARINDWLIGWNQMRSHRRTVTGDDLVLNVEDDDAPVERIQDEPRDSKASVWMALDRKLQSECSLVTELCHSMQVKLQAEEIVTGIMHSSAQLIMVSAMQSFVTDLIRRAYASKTKSDRNSPSSSMTHVVSADDLRNCMSTTSHFDFLTNRYFGTDLVKTESTQL